MGGGADQPFAEQRVRQSEQGRVRVDAGDVRFQRTPAEAVAADGDYAGRRRHRDRVARHGRQAVLVRADDIDELRRAAPGRRIGQPLRCAPKRDGRRDRGVDAARHRTAAAVPGRAAPRRRSRAPRIARARFAGRKAGAARACRRSAAKARCRARPARTCRGRWRRAGSCRRQARPRGRIDARGDDVAMAARDRNDAAGGDVEAHQRDAFVGAAGRGEGCMVAAAGAKISSSGTTPSGRPSPKPQT